MTTTALLLLRVSCYPLTKTHQEGQENDDDDDSEHENEHEKEQHEISKVENEPLKHIHELTSSSSQLIVYSSYLTYETHLPIQG